MPVSGFVDRLLQLPPYGLSREEKEAALAPAVREELTYHYEHCTAYRRWCEKQQFDPRSGVTDLAAVPFLPVNVFKRLSLSSVPEDQIVRVVTSSATSSQIPSRVTLDQTTRTRQVRALAALLTYLLGGARRPFLLLDAAPTTAADGRELSARVAGIRGYLIAATRQEYVLKSEDDRLELDLPRFRRLAAEWTKAGEPFCLLGYTAILYQNVVAPLWTSKERIALPPATKILHFGGWKRLREQAVDKKTLNDRTAEVFGIPPSAVCDIYGFTEQLGVIYPDDAQGLKRAPTYAEVFVRDPRTLEVLPDGQVGLLEFVCPLPHGYPGVALLLDDLGRVVAREPGPDGMTGTGFEIVGRAERAEIRGCGDTLPQRVYEPATAKRD
ncbi:MAG: hypothetical protein JXB10_06755 [Pirellulales bacterium]|nr:hypothetical protein [Pirellulales bacterium]